MYGRRLVSLCFGCAALVLGEAARAAPLRVGLEPNEAEHGTVRARLLDELRSTGYEPVLLASERARPCAASTTSATASLPAFVTFARDADSGDLLAVVCYVRPSGSVERVLVRAPQAEPERLALAVVEALNGLAATTMASPAPTRAAAPRPPAVGGHAVSAQAALLADAVSGITPVGGQLGIEAKVSRALGMALETFVPMSEGHARGVERELSLGAGFVRLAARVGWSRAPLRFGASAAAGAALVWTSAQSRSPERLGTTKTAAVALLTGGVWLECPSTSRLFLRAAASASRALPSVDVARGDGSYAPFGALLLDASLGIGVRWGE